jgi:hypothetical protein
MSNLGISYQQPFLPTRFIDLPGTDKVFVETDPFWNTQPKEWKNAYATQPYEPYINQAVNPPVNGPGMTDRRDIYDPRFTGYGTSYRQYNDPMVGQPRFYYDDVDAHTQYNYITRSKIDHLPQAQSAGPYSTPMMDNWQTRQYADESFHNAVLQQRTELQNRLMQKSLHRTVQRHQAPIMTRNTGSMSLSRAKV